MASFVLIKRSPQIFKMASAEAIAKLETKAVAAERLISLLKSQIAEVKAAKASGQSNEYTKEMDQLKMENSQLKADIEEWKVKLSAAEAANGKKVYCSTSSTATNSSAPPVTEKVEKTEEKPKQTQEKAKEKKPKSDKPAKEKKEPKQDTPEVPPNIGLLDLRVGHIRSAKKHPDADALYVEEVDVGEEKPRTVISGLVKFIPEPEMQDRMAVLLCNLKPSKMRGIMSEAMVMCASTPDKVEIMAPPPGSKPGDVVLVDGFTRDSNMGQLNPKKKIFEAVAPDLKVNGDKQATYKGVLWTVNGEPVTSQSLTNVNIK